MYAEEDFGVLRNEGTRGILEFQFLQDVFVEMGGRTIIIAEEDAHALLTIQDNKSLWR